MDPKKGSGTIETETILGEMAILPRYKSHIHIHRQGLTKFTSSYTLTFIKEKHDFKLLFKCINFC